MPLASPSSLTSNTLAKFLDYVPISINNAEKWKPKQMGSNSGEDYWALSRALSAPLGTERWILHHLFLSTGTEEGGQKAVAALCLHVPEMSTERFKCSFLSAKKMLWMFIIIRCNFIMAVKIMFTNELHSIMNLLFTNDHKHQLQLYNKRLFNKCLINHFIICEQGKLINSECWLLQSVIVIYIYGNICLTIYKTAIIVTIDQFYYIHVGPVACKQCLILCQQRVVLLTDTKKQHTAVRTCLDVWLWPLLLVKTAA